MTPPNQIINLIKEASAINRISLGGAGYKYPSAPVTREQAALICLSYALDLARIITQCCEDGLYEAVFEVMSETENPKPW